MRWMAVACVAALAGCAAPETPYQVRLRYSCGRGDAVACEAAKSLKDEPPRPRSGTDMSGVAGFLADVLGALPIP